MLVIKIHNLLEITVFSKIKYIKDNMPVSTSVRFLSQIYCPNLLVSNVKCKDSGMWVDLRSSTEF